jgi:hypothetical protein
MLFKDQHADHDRDVPAYYSQYWLYGKNQLPPVVKKVSN